MGNQQSQRKYPQDKLKVQIQESQSISSNQFFQSIGAQSPQQFKYPVCKQNFLDMRFSQGKKASKQLSFQLQQVKRLSNNLNDYSSSENDNLDEQLIEKHFFSEKQNNYNQFDFHIRSIASHIFDKNQDKQYSQLKNVKFVTQKKLIGKSYQKRNSMKSLQTKSRWKQIKLNTQFFTKPKQKKLQDQYQIIKKIGQGSFGQVFQARSIKNNQIVAVKTFKKHIIKQSKQAYRIATQIQILRSLDHPNIIKIFDVFYNDDLYYVVTQYCCGGTLRDYINKHKTIKDQKMIQIIMKQIIYGLAYLHSKQIMHRDIKLENIVFQNDPEKCQTIQDVQIKIIDFGLAVKSKYKGLNKDKKFIGTPKYMSPEILQGKYSQKCDIWSCGIILYIFLTGLFPFSGVTVEQTYKKITSLNIDFETPFWKRKNQNMVNLLKKMLEKNYFKRISASEALKNNFFSRKQQNEGKDDVQQKLFFSKKLIEYRPQNNFITLVEYFIVIRQLKLNKQTKKLFNMFKEIDRNNDGMIQVEELAQFFPQIKNQDNQNTLFKDIIDKIDKDKSGRLQISEFMAAITERSQLFTKQNLSDTFQFLDADKSGFIQRQQLQIAMPNCQKEQYDTLMFDIDLDGDDRISKDEFFQYFKVIESDKII